MKKNTLKKLTGFLAVVMMSGFIMGCSGGANESSSTANNEATEAESSTEKKEDAADNSADTPKEESGSGEKIVIRIGAHVANPEEQEPGYYNIFKRFDEMHDNIEIEIIATDTDNHIKNMKMAAQSGELPDVFWMLPAPAKEMAEAGYLLSYDEFLSETPEVTDNMQQNMLDVVLVNGQRYGLPCKGLVTGFWYNKDIFEANNIAVPTTFDEYMAAAEVLSAKDISLISQGAKDPFSVWALMTMMCRYGYYDKIWDILEEKESFNNPEFLTFYQRLDELTKAGAFPTNVSTMDYYQMKDLFINGGAAMLDSGIWEAKALQDAMGGGENLGFVWGPQDSEKGVGNQKVKMVVPQAPWLISAKVGDNPELYAAVKELMKFYYTEGSQVFLEFLDAPATNFEYTPDPANPAFNAVIEAMQEDGYDAPIMQPDNVYTEAYGNALYDSMYGVINGIYTPEEAIGVCEGTLPPNN